MYFGFNRTYSNLAHFLPYSYEYQNRLFIAKLDLLNHWGRVGQLGYGRNTLTKAYGIDFQSPLHTLGNL